MRYWRRPISLLLLACLAASCTSWHVVPLQPKSDQDLPAHMRVTVADGSRFMLDRPMMSADTLRGWRCRTSVTTKTCEEVAIPLRSIVLGEDRRLSGWKTGLLIGIPVAVIAGIAIGCAGGACDTGAW